MPPPHTHTSAPPSTSLLDDGANKRQLEIESVDEPSSTEQRRIVDELLEPPSLAQRITPVLAELAMVGELSWTEVAFVLDAVAYFDEAAARRERIVHRLLGGEEEPR